MFINILLFNAVLFKFKIKIRSIFVIHRQQLTRLLSSVCLGCLRNLRNCWLNARGCHLRYSLNSACVKYKVSTLCIYYNAT